MINRRLKFFTLFLLVFCWVGAGYGGGLFSKLELDLGDDTTDNDVSKIPIIYHPGYNIDLGESLQKLHQFDGRKYGKVFDFLVTTVGISKDSFYTPVCVSNEDLLKVHSEQYLASLKNPKTIATIAEVPEICACSIETLQNALLLPMKLGTRGTVFGAQLALNYGWAINLAGGYHHAKRDGGAGFCFFADIALAIKKVWEKKPKCKVMIIDLDVHLGNGDADFFAWEERVTIFDMYNEDIYPHDEEAKEFIRDNIPLKSGITGEAYLDKLKNNLPAALSQSNPDLIIYNAGTDIWGEWKVNNITKEKEFVGDPLGKMCVSQAYIIERDAFVFQQALSRKIPILMVLSGGYTPQSAEIIGASIKNILENVIKLKKESSSSSDD